MPQKRQPEEQQEEEEQQKAGSSSSSPDEKRQKLRSVVMEAVKMNAVQKLLSAIEPLIRRVVKEEVEMALQNHLASMTRQCGNRFCPSTSRSLQLQFKNRLSLPIFTGTKIEGEDGSVINIALVDSLTGQVVMSGPESLVKVEIVVLEGDFEGGEVDSWTFEEFKNNIVKEREGKRSLLTGDVFLDLNEGIGVVGDLSFTDNSSWTRSRKFRLGARIVDGYSHGMRVREAKTEPFMVKDHRGELYKKHYPPLLWDEVWRLEKIGKDGAFHKRLSSENIYTVKDFLTLLSADAQRLRNILGSGMSTKMWEITVEHARTCTLPGQIYVYFASDDQQRNTGPGVVFNVVGEPMGLLLQHQLVSFHDLSENEKADARSLLKLALENWNDVVAYDDIVGAASHAQVHPTSFPTGSNTQCFPHNIYSSNFGPSSINKAINAASSGGFGFTSSPDDIYIASTRSSGSGSDNAYALHDSLQGMGSRYEPQEVPPTLLSCRSNLLMLDECTASQTLFYSGEDTLQQYLDSDVSLLPQNLSVTDSPADLGTAVTGFLAMSARSRDKADKAYTVWGTILSVLRWRFSIKKIVAMKKRVRQKEILG